MTLTDKQKRALEHAYWQVLNSPGMAFIASGLDEWSQDSEGTYDYRAKAIDNAGFELSVEALEYLSTLKLRFEIKVSIEREGD